MIATRTPARPQFPPPYALQANIGARIRQAGRGRILLLAAIPAIDPIVNQIYTIYQVSFGPLSMLQVVRGALFILALAMVATSPRAAGKVGRAVGAIVLSIALCLTVIAAHEGLASDGLVLPSLIAYSQIEYWLLMWYLGAAWITDSTKAGTVANGLVAGALITAASVYYGYVIGVPTVYRMEGVAASSGWFISAKGIAGSLVTGGLVAAYLGHRRRSGWMTLVALFCLGASFLTYARAGMVALLGSLTWLCVWSLGTRLKASLWARRLLIAAVCGAAVLVYSIGTEDLLMRWADVGSSDAAGSGRVMIWKAAIDNILSGTPSDQVFGHGFDGMLDLIYASIGVRLHTHNDVFDMLLVGGLFGLLILALVFSGLVTQLQAHPKSPEFAVAVGILIVLCCQGFFTGQMFLPDVMAYYLLSITTVLAFETGGSGEARRFARAGRRT